MNNLIISFTDITKVHQTPNIFNMNNMDILCINNTKKFTILVFSFEFTNIVLKFCNSNQNY